MAMHDIRLSTRSTLATPHSSEFDSVPQEPFGKTLSELCEEFAVRIVSRICQRPFD